MRHCLVCGVGFYPPAGRGRPPEPCSPECTEKRKSEKRKEAQERAAKRGVVPAHAHGTSTGYTYYKCPCVICKKWAREYKQSQRAEAKAAATPRVRSRAWIYHPGSVNRARSTNPTR